MLHDYAVDGVRACALPEARRRLRLGRQRRAVDAQFSRLLFAGDKLRHR